MDLDLLQKAIGALIFLFALRVFINWAKAIR
jgi:hypothetical protein